MWQSSISYSKLLCVTVPHQRPRKRKSTDFFSVAVQVFLVLHGLVSHWNHSLLLGVRRTNSSIYPPRPKDIPATAMATFPAVLTSATLVVDIYFPLSISLDFCYGVQNRSKTHRML